MSQLSRREFLVLSIASVAFAALSSDHAGLLALPSSSDAPPAQPDEEFAAYDFCPGCAGGGAIVCPACYGTGIWAEESEAAGLYQREAARALNHCAWCSERGEVVCPDCEGIGKNISLKGRSGLPAGH